MSVNDYSIFLADIKLWFEGPKDLFKIDKAELQNDIKPKLFPLKQQIRKFFNFPPRGLASFSRAKKSPWRGAGLSP